MTSSQFVHSRCALLLRWWKKISLPFLFPCHEAKDEFTSPYSFCDLKTPDIIQGGKKCLFYNSCQNTDGLLASTIITILKKTLYEFLQLFLQLNITLFFVKRISCITLHCKCVYKVWVLITILAFYNLSTDLIYKHTRARAHTHTQTDRQTQTHMSTHLYAKIYEVAKSHPVPMFVITESTRYFIASTFFRHFWYAWLLFLPLLPFFPENASFVLSLLLLFSRLKM